LGQEIRKEQRRERKDCFINSMLSFHTEFVSLNRPPKITIIQNNRDSRSGAENQDCD